MSDVLKGRPKGPNLTSEGQNVVFKARRFPVDEYDLVDHTGMSQGHANNILLCMGCFDYTRGKFYERFDPTFRKDNSNFCDKCCYGPKGSATMCSQYPFPKTDNQEIITHPEFLKPDCLQIYRNRNVDSRVIWLNASQIAQEEGLGLDLVDFPYPQDCYVFGDNCIIASGDDRTLFSPSCPVRIHNKLFEGGRYAFGQDTVFCALNEVSDNDAKLVASAFPTRQVYFVPTPERLGLVRRRRVLSHLDQYMGGALATYDGTYVIPIDASYLAASNFAEHNQDGKFKFFPVSPSLLDGMKGHHLLNYVLAPSGRTYLCPQMMELLKRADRNLHIDWRQIVELPFSVPVNSIKAGLKCCINFV